MKIFTLNFKKLVSLGALLMLLSVVYQTKAQVVGYGLDANGDIVRFDDLEGDPGSFVVVGNSGAAEFPSGLDRDALGNWYLVDNQNTNFLYKINQALGTTATLVGGSGLEPDYAPQDLAWDEKNNRLLAVAIDATITLGSSPYIYEIDVNTGVATPIGGGTGEVTGIVDGLVLGLAVDPVTGEIYILGGETERWYKIDENLTPSSLVELNDLGYDVNFGQGGDIGGTANKLYHAATSNDLANTFELHEIDKTTGDIAVVFGSFDNQMSDIFIHEPFTNDIVYGDLLIQPCDGTATLRIGNIGTTDLTSTTANPIVVSYEITSGPGAGTIVTENLPDGTTIAVNDVFTYDFIAGITGGIGAYTIDVDIDMSAIGVDGNTTNNGETGLTFSIVAPVGLPLVEDFEDGDIPAEWTRSTADLSITEDQIWYYGDAASVSSGSWEVPDNGSGNLMAANDDALDHNASEDRLITPAISMDAVTPGNEVWMFFDAYFEENTLGFFGPTEAASVEVSTDGGLNWTTELQLEGSVDWQEDLKVDLTSYIGETCILVAFRYDDQGEFAFGFAVDNVEVKEVWPNDAGATALVFPLEDGSCLGSEVVTVEIKNLGINPAVDVPVTIDVNGTSVTETVPGPIEFCETGIYTFSTTLDFSSTTNTVTITTGTDDDDSNNEFVTTVTNVLPINLPFSEDFESGNPLDPAIGERFRQSFNLPNDGGWTYGTADLADLGIVGFFNIPGDPTNQLLATREKDDDVNKSADRLILPPFDFSPYDGVRFFADVLFIDNIGNSTAEVQVSTDKGATWTTIRTLNSSENDPGNNAFEEVEINLTDYAGLDCVILSFLYNDGGEWAEGLAIDNINVVEIPDFDARPVAISIDNCSEIFAPITVTIENIGTKAFDSFEVSYTTGGTTVTEVVNQEVLPFTTFDYTFTQTLDISTGGPTFTFDLNVTLLSATDQDMSNDNLTGISVTVPPSASLTPPYSEDFEGGFPADWTRTSLGNGWLEFDENAPPFTIYTPFPDGENNSIFMVSDDDEGGGGNDASEDYLVMPAFNFSAYSNLVLTFEGTISDFAGSGELTVEYSLDGGSNWTIIYDYLDEFDENEWNDVTVNLPSDLEGESNVLIAFHYDDEGAFAWGAAVDNINLTGFLSGGTSNITANTPVLVPADSVLRGTQDHLLYRMEASIADFDATLKDIAFRTGGTYETSDIAPGTVKFWYNTTDDVSTAILIDSKTVVPSGELLPFSCLDQDLPIGTYYFYLTASIADNAVDGRTIFIEALDINNFFIFNDSNNSGSPSAGGEQLIIRPNTPAVSSDKEIDILTNETYTFEEGDFEFEDADIEPVDVKSGVKIAELNLPTGSSLTFNGTAVASGLEIPIDQIGNLSFTPALNESGDDYASFDFKISDGREFSPFDWSIIFNVAAGAEPFLPSAFAPDGVAPSNVFRIASVNLSEVSLKVFDRQGNVVFETTDVTEATVTGWDGTKDGEPQPMGAYIWYAKGTTTDGSELKVNGKNTGVIKLVR